MSDCIFCNIISGDIPSKPLLQNESFIVIEDIHPQAPVHVLVIPKKHYVDITDMEDDVYQSYMAQVRDVIKSLKISKFRIVHNGRGAQFVPHAHMHILGSVEADRNL